MAVNLHSTHYRFGVNELAESTHGWHAALDTNPAQGVPAVDTTFLLRFTVQETGGTAAGNTDQQFQCSLNGGAFQDITTASTVVKAVTTTVFANGADLTKRLTGTGTFESSGDGGTHDGLSGGPQNDIAASGNSETECALQIVGADVSANDVITFRLTSPDFTITNDVVPTLTIAGATPTRGLISWAELEMPLVPTRGLVSWAELEVPLAPTRGLVSWAELEVPITPTRGLVSWAEVEIPDAVSPTRGLVSWSELETPPPPADPTRGLISWAEFEVALALTRGLISWVELEVPLVPTRGLVSWAEFEAPLAPTRGLISWGELEVPSAPTRGLISWVEFAVPDEDAGGDLIGSVRGHGTTSGMLMGVG